MTLYRKCILANFGNHILNTVTVTALVNLYNTFLFHPIHLPCPRKALTFAFDLKGQASVNLRANNI